VALGYSRTGAAADASTGTAAPVDPEVCHAPESSRSDVRTGTRCGMPRLGGAMNESPPSAYDDVQRALLARWPESRLEPSLDRVRALVHLLGDPQTSVPVIQLTGTNGKTSTARMVDGLLREMGLRTGRFTSPHLESMTERISLDGDVMTEEQFVAAYTEVAPYLPVVERTAAHPLSFFETVTAMAYAAFAEAPVDVAVVEVGMGGAWDATNVADAQVSIISPIAVDHASYLGDTPADIAVEKAGIIKAGSFAVLAAQQPDVLDVLGARAADVGAQLAVEGQQFAVVTRVPGVGGQLLTLQGLAAEYTDVFLPLLGAHQAHNAALALAAVEAFVGSIALDVDVVRGAFAAATSPGRLEVVRRSPVVVLDAAHNPAGVERSSRRWPRRSPSARSSASWASWPTRRSNRSCRCSNR
jgi:dihydrofolate synthase/folylpolyglutamate synthase